MLKNCHIVLVAKNEIRNISVVCECLIITERHDVYTFIFESLFNMNTSRTKEMVYALFSDEFTTKSLSDSMNINNTFIFYHRYRLKFNLDKNLYLNGRYYNHLLN